MKKTKKTKRRALTALASLVLGSCLAASCGTDMRDAFYSGVLDYITGNTTSLLNCAFTTEGCGVAE